MTIDKQALRERYSPQPIPKCHICGAEMTVQRMSASRITYGCTGATYDDNGCHYVEGRSIADDHYEQSRITVVDVSDPDVLTLLDEMEAAEHTAAVDHEAACSLVVENEELKRKLEAAERELDNWRTSFNNERFRADKLAEAFKTEHEQLVMAHGALITQHIRANRAESSIVLLEAEKSALRRALNNLAAVARRYLPDYDEHPDIQAADDLLESAAGIGKGE